MLVGYARVSTVEQNLDLQLDALKKAGCEKIYEDIASGSKTKRDGLKRILSFIRNGDTLVVWKLDRLGRSLRHLIIVVNRLINNGVFLISLQEKIDTNSPGGKLVFHVFGALAEFERDIIRERTIAGLNAARERGRVGDRKRVMDKKMIRMARTLMADHKTKVKDVCTTLGVSRSTLYRYLKEKPAS